MSIWKDPRVELPNRITDTCHGGIDEVVCLCNGGGFISCTYDKDDNVFREYYGFETYDREVSFIKKWCYEEDLIKKAGE